MDINFDYLTDYFLTDKNYYYILFFYLFEMGAEQSVALGIVKSKNFTILGCKENDVYGSFKLIESNGVQYAMISKTCQNHEDYTKLC